MNVLFSHKCILRCLSFPVEFCNELLNAHCTRNFLRYSTLIPVNIFAEVFGRILSPSKVLSTTGNARNHYVAYLKCLRYLRRLWLQECGRCGVVA